MSFWQTYYHIVWATKHRQETITPEMEAVLFPYMQRKAKELDVIVYALNGWTDHVHLVAGIPPKLSVAEVMKRLKGSAARRINSQPGLSAAPFVWQVGYGVMTLGRTQLDRAVAYVENQKQHHADQKTNAWLEYSAEETTATVTGMVVVNETPNVYIADPYPF